MSRNDNPRDRGGQQDYRRWRRDNEHGPGGTHSADTGGAPHRDEPQAPKPPSGGQPGGRSHHDAGYQDWHSRQAPAPKDGGETR